MTAKVALIHDWLTGLRGGERVLLEFLKLYPNADIFTLVHAQGKTTPEIDNRVVETSILNRIPGITKIYRHLLPLYPFAANSLRVEGYDLAISLSHAAAKNVNVSLSTPHLCFCFTPMRYIWDQAPAYFGRKTPLLAPLLSALRTWDKEGAAKVTAFSAISSFVKARIRCFYQRNAEVIFPPVRLDWIDSTLPTKRGEAFLYAGALVPYKRADLVVEAFNKARLPLWVAGDGPLLKELRSRASSNITFLGSVSDRELSSLYHRCRALVFPGVEDFGLIPVECMASGRPIIAIRKGGAGESVSGLHHWKNEPFIPSSHTGVFIKPDGVNSLDSLLSALQTFERVEDRFDPSVCRERALLFSPDRFQVAWKAFERRWITKDVKAEAQAR